VKAKTLELEFAAGTVYEYLDVSEFTFRALMLASSKHAFFTKSIEGQYRCQQVRNDELFPFPNLVLLGFLALGLLLPGRRDFLQFHARAVEAFASSVRARPRAGSLITQRILRPVRS